MEEIFISYKAEPPGQVGPRPQQLTPGTSIIFTCKETADFTIHFVGESPLSDGATTVKGGKVVQVGTLPGTFDFMCVLTVDGKQIKLGDPSNPSSVPGGQVRV